MKRRIISFVIAGGILAFSPMVNGYAFGDELQVTMPQRVYLDSPTYNEIINNNNIVVRGWALDNSGIKEVKVYIDGNYLGNAQIGMQRNDVDAAYPGYTEGVTSGYSYEINSSIIAPGKHTIKIEAIGNDLSIESTETVIELKSLETKTQDFGIKTLNVTSTQSQINVSNLQPKTYIDGPTGIINNQDIKVNGWALNPSGLKEIKVYIDGVLKGSTTTGIVRGDVNAAFPGYPGGDKSGYGLTIAKDKVSSGKHTLRVEAIGNDGTSHKSESQIDLLKPQPRTYIDGPAGTINNQDIKVNGWALNPSGVKEIKVYIDGVLKGSTTTGIVRGDVNAAFPGYPGGDKSGYGLTIAKDKVSSGKHTLRIEAIGNDGTTNTSESQINVVKPQPRTYIDGPTGIINNQDIKVNGWALNASGVKEIKVYMDGKLMGSTIPGILRRDVNAAFPGYPGGDKSGYGLTISKDKVLPGSHILKVEAIGNDGTTNTSESQINVVKPPNRTYIDSPSGSIMLNGQMLQVTGWAINASGVKEIKVYIDGILEGNTTTTTLREDVNAAFPGYPDGLKSGFGLLVDSSKLSSGKHIIIVEAIGQDGSIQKSETTISDLKILEQRILSYTYNDHVDKQIAIGGNVKWATGEDGKSKFVPASLEEIKYYMDHNNFQNPKGMYQFLKLNTYREIISESELNAYLNRVLVNPSTNGLSNQAKIFIEAAKENNIDVIYLVAHALWETGYGSSPLSKGIVVTHYKGEALPEPVKVYNFFGIGAFDRNANVYGAEAAYSNGWTSPELAIKGAAKWISDGYINNQTYNQKSLYFMKWNYDPTLNLVEWRKYHQYATDINWANGIANKMYDMSYLYNLDRAGMVYDIPTYTSK